MRDIGKKIKNLRPQKGLTQDAPATRILESNKKDSLMAVF